MKKLISSVFVVAAVVAMTSCATTTTPVGRAMLYTGVDDGKAVTSNNVGKLAGSSSAMNVLGLVAIGDASINKAAKEGGITKISHVDTKTTSVLGLFTSCTTTVYGE